MPRGRRDRSNFGKGLGTLEYPSTMPSKRAADRSSLGTHDIARAPAQPALSSCGFTPVRPAHPVRAKDDGDGQVSWLARSEEHTSELQSLMRISYAVFCLKKKKNYYKTTTL